jgi:hypothetical protein
VRARDQTISGALGTNRDVCQPRIGEILVKYWSNTSSWHHARLLTDARLDPRGLTGSPRGVTPIHPLTVSAWQSAGLEREGIEGGQARDCFTCS